MKQFWIALALAVVALVISALLIGGRSLFGQAPNTQGAQAPTLPWQIETLPDGGSQVMGLKLGHGAQTSTLADARQRWGQDMQVAIIAAPGENGTLEAFVDPAQAGFISGKLVITAQLPADVIKGMRERALKGEFMESTTRKYVLSPDDMNQALNAPITAMSFIPQANLDEDMIVTRFGQPTERVRSNGHLEHFLYPDKGLDLALDSQGKELLQYVAPADFNRLRQPLKTAP